MKKDAHPLKAFMQEGVVEAGCDEAGRGCLAGPVYAAAVILPPDFECEGLTDSKQLTARQRYKLRPIIEEKALAWAVGIVSAQEIDEINILRSSIKAMQLALDQLKVRPQHILVDGNRFTPYKDIPYHTVIKGDATYLSIAAASILAKTYRDDYMSQLAEEFPMYNWEKNKGYPTAEHRDAIAKYGASPHHRMTFTLLDKQLKIDFGDF